MKWWLLKNVAPPVVLSPNGISILLPVIWVSYPEAGDSIRVSGAGIVPKLNSCIMFVISDDKDDIAKITATTPLHKVVVDEYYKTHKELKENQ